ncbi:chromosome segregation protein SMC [Salinisphaera sp. PC39]|uniref:chromosome segregation protein SMC n=1 Tax=Salinisphaera sp. PC39 TaxID=1304156 RepID=UPI0033413310
MRLSAIKLAGFKSFVDPTTLRLTSNLTGIVGPNGCGKSNVIDAVRWVTGESSAKQLRGEALEDVIFNGSKARKPVGRAAIELLFDNSDGKLGGQYAAFAEIAVRRELSRDGGSQYYINGSRCRRRDVVDLFLGTGLGGRSNYAVIEQGAVNRLIEAKPEDMRQVLEEAAGISKYKERRRETENRIRHTRENLDRVSDLIAEVAQRLAQLKRQAANAEKYKQYKAEERRLRAELLALRWRGLHAEAEKHRETLEARKHDLETARGRVREIGGEAERRRGEQQTAGEECQRLQADFYAAEAEVARVEQALAHARELRQVRETEHADLERQLAELDERDRAEARSAEELREAIETRTRELAEAEREAESAGERLAQAESAAREGEREWESLNEDDNPVQRAQAERASLEHLEAELADIGERLDKRLGERQRLDADAPQRALAETEDALSRLNAELAGLQSDHEAVAAEAQRLRDERARQDATLHEVRQALANARGRLSSLEALQQAALREDDDSVQGWLAEQDWTDAAGVAHSVRVAEGWETAAETALGGFLRALAVPGLADRVARLSQWPEQSLTLLAADGDDDGREPPPGPGGSTSLAAVLDAPPALRRVARRIFLVEDTSAAHAALSALDEGQMLVTRDGVCFGPGWVRTPRTEDAEQGVLRREQGIDEARREVARLETAEREGAETLADIRRRLDEAESARGDHGSRLDDLRRRHGERLAERQGLSVRAEQVQRRGRELDAEIEDLRQRRDEREAAIAEARRRLDTVADAAREFVQRRQAMQERLQRLREERDNARAARERAGERRQSLELSLAGRRSELEAAERRRQELTERRRRTAERRDTLGRELAEERETEAGDRGKEAAETRRDEARRALDTARERLAAAETRVEEVTRQARAAEAAVEEAREAAEQSRVAYETAAVRRQGIEEQLAETGHAPAALVAELPDDATPEDWEGRIDALERRIQRLGAINLAAIEEFESEQERETYLQEQHTDLSEALATLEQAIAKIDRETRSRFRHTYERINERFGALFPVLFGGGEARLELTEDDLLATGVRVMARPPGKRNASIQMLSGGEKAMTAVALLFALFELNPAPFCMLDEIDAPLDDANVARFCDLVRQMSEHVQFIVITHNKLTMELVQQLHGVTMQEPGVSRLVSVDIEQALEMAG